MLRDYALSLTLVALVILGYTAVLLSYKKGPADSRTEASVQPATQQAPPSVPEPKP